jgi:hypothetical protein
MTNRRIATRQFYSFWSRCLWLLAACAAGTVVAVGATRYPLLDAAAVPSVAALLGLLAICRLLRPAKPSSAHRIVALCVAAFALHLFIGLVINHSPTLVRYLGGDAVTYDEGARGIVAHWQNTSLPLPAMGAGKEGFYYGLAALYWAFGAFPVAGLALNAFFAAALVPLVADLTRRLFGDDAAWWAAGIVVLQPGLLIWTSQLLREAGVLFFLAIALDCVVRLARHATPAVAVVLGADLALLLTFRANVAVVAASGLAIGLLLGRKRIAGGFVSAAAVLVLAIVLVGAGGVGRAGYQASSNASLQQINLARGDLSASAASGFGRGANVSTPSRAITYLPLGLPSFLFGPFPWQVGGFRQLLGWLEALTILGLTPAIWRGWRSSRRQIGRLGLILVVPATALAVSLSLLIGNYGTVVRERLQVLLFVVPLAALGLSQRREHNVGDPSDSEVAAGILSANLTSPSVS